MIRVFLLFVSLLMLCPPAKASENIDLSKWKTLPILHEGRIKPLDSFAKIYLKTFSGNEKIDNLNANQWLAETIFTPDIAVKRPVHFSRYKNLKGEKYTHQELAKIIFQEQEAITKLLEIPMNQQTSEQEELVRLYENFILHSQLLRSMTALLPLDLEGDGTIRNYLYYTGKDNAETIEEKLSLIKKGGENNVLLRIVPTQDKTASISWKSPWESVSKTTNTAYINSLQQIAAAYLAGNQNIFDQKISKLKNLYHNPKLKIEVVYNQLSLLKISSLFFILTFFLASFSNFTRTKKRERILHKLSLSCLGIGLISLIIHTALRIYLLDRPPVGTLYESIIFVALVCVAGFWFLTYRQKENTGLLLGSISGLLLLTTSQAFVGADTMSTLVAVLNTNFWLTTHVLCISIGYGLCLITSLIAHYALAVCKPYDMIRTIKTMAIFSLLFTTIGTILGGLWADQSWGRFWGWDPKENGALLIVLWLIWLLHSHISKHLDRTTFTIGAAFLSIIVVLAWFGVNLLNVGLHSYGFISGIAWGIAIFCLVETMLITALSWRYYKKSKNNGASQGGT
jgi:ABC-type transport system involved in cytochrome c biogenesis permease subunit